jgi:hypothetical protein
MSVLPDDAIVIRGGQNMPENFERGSGVTVGPGGILKGVSVNAGAGVSARQLTAPNPQTGYPGILNNQIGTTTVGAIRAQGGEVTPSPTRTNPHHATLEGITSEQASALFRPTRPNPSRSRTSESN